uniref:Uncharacterized protein n=1 Tax=Arundo donax TaxID=35708 RepID=A0A0A9G125_ARUDO
MNVLKNHHTRASNHFLNILDDTQTIRGHYHFPCATIFSKS